MFARLLFPIVVPGILTFDFWPKGFVHIFYAKEEWENFVSQEDKNKINKVKLMLYLNRALCKIKLAKIDDALWDCDQVGACFKQVI